MFARVPKAESKITNLQLAIELSQDSAYKGEWFRPFPFQSNKPKGTCCEVCGKQILPGDHSIPYTRKERGWNKGCYMHATHAEGYTGKAEKVEVSLPKESQEDFSLWKGVLAFTAEKDDNSNEKSAPSTRYYHNIIGAFIAHKGEVLSSDEVSSLIGVEPKQIRYNINYGSINNNTEGPVRAFKDQLFKYGEDAWVFRPSNAQKEEEKELQTRQSVSPLVTKYFINNPHRDITVEEISEAINRSPGQVRDAVTNLKNRKREGAGDWHRKIKVISRGNVWRFEPEEPEPSEEPEEAPAPKKGEIKQINTTNNGRIIRLPHGTVIYSDEDCVIDLAEWQENSY